AACDRCPACRLCAAGTHPDLYTAAKPEDKAELPVEVIRAFCDQLALTPTRGVRTIGLVEDADDFNEESANAFLKTLEEPAPRSVLVLLATTEEGQLPTIRSRCQAVRFHPLPAADVAAVLAGHGVTDPAALDRLVRLAAGSPGRALALAGAAVGEFRAWLVTAVCHPKPGPAAVADRLLRFVED